MSELVCVCVNEFMDSKSLFMAQVGAPIVDAVGLIGAARANAGDTAPIDLVFFRCRVHKSI